jgi:hypothetical protein
MATSAGKEAQKIQKCEDVIKTDLIANASRWENDGTGCITCSMGGVSY